jgi:hypothetical protein
MAIFPQGELMQEMLEMMDEPDNLHCSPPLIILTVHALAALSMQRCSAEGADGEAT